MCLYAVITLGMVMMTDAADGKGDIGKKRMIAGVGVGLFALFFSLILSIFKQKAGGYPYRFLLQIDNKECIRYHYFASREERFRESMKVSPTAVDFFIDIRNDYYLYVILFQ